MIACEPVLGDTGVEEPIFLQEETLAELGLGRDSCRLPEGKDDKRGEHRGQTLGKMNVINTE